MQQRAHKIGSESNIDQQIALTGKSGGLMALYSAVRSDWKIIASTYICATLLGVYSFVREPRLYEARTVIFSATSSSNAPSVVRGLLKTPAQLEQLILEGFDVANKFRSERRLPRLSGARALNDVIFISALGSSPEEAKSFLKNFAEDFLAQANFPLQEAVKLHEEKLASMEQDIRGLERSLNELPKVVDLGGSQDAGASVVVVLERAKLREQLLAIKEELSFKKTQLLSIKDSLIRTLQAPTVVNDGRPVSPRLLYHCIITILAGLLASLALIFAKATLRRV